ncbi:MAG: flagellar basal body L-ring protein FlgH [Pseudomonadota bacterium]
MTRIIPTFGRSRTITYGVCLLAISACGRLDHIGQPPPFTPAGQSTAAETSVAPERVALATPAPMAARTAAIQSPPAVQVRPRTASLWRSGPASLFGDRRAQGRGDILTVVIEIDEEAAISNATERSRTANEDLAVGALLGLPDLVQDLTGIDIGNAAQVSSGAAHAGDVSVRRTEEIALRLAATVAEVLPNGHFVIVGSQEVRVNFELRDLRVHGVVRPEDISRGNEITYDKIADARISYGGRGQITDVQQPRYGQQIADVILPF